MIGGDAPRALGGGRLAESKLEGPPRKARTGSGCANAQSRAYRHGHGWSSACAPPLQALLPSGLRDRHRPMMAPIDRSAGFTNSTALRQAVGVSYCGLPLLEVRWRCSRSEGRTSTCSPRRSASDRVLPRALRAQCRHAPACSADSYYLVDVGAGARAAAPLMKMRSSLSPFITSRGKATGGRRCAGRQPSGGRRCVRRARWRTSRGLWLTSSSSSLPSCASKC